MNRSESTIDLKINSGQKAEFERVGEKLKSDVENNESDALGYHVWISPDGTNASLIQKTSSTNGGRTYFGTILRKHISELERTAKITGFRTYGMPSDVLKTAAEISGNLRSPVTYDHVTGFERNM
jgi:hypothetical protein